MDSQGGDGGSGLGGRPSSTLLSARRTTKFQGTSKVCAWPPNRSNPSPSCLLLRDSRVDETLDNGHAALGELLLGVTASSVGNVDGMVDVDVVGERDVLDLNATLCQLFALSRVS